MSDQSNVPATEAPSLPNTLAPTDRALFSEAHHRAAHAVLALRAAQTELDAATQYQRGIYAMLGGRYGLTDADRVDIATGAITRNAVPAPAAQ